MNRSESIVNLAKALNEAQKNILSAKKDSANPYFKSKYADLSAVMEACKPSFNAVGISILQPVVLNADGSHGVETILLHESGEFISSIMKLELKNVTMQELGSAISYARRYALQSTAFVPAADDDGESLMKRTSSAPQLSTGASVAKVDELAGGGAEVTPLTQRRRTFKKDTSNGTTAAVAEVASESDNF